MLKFLLVIPMPAAEAPFSPGVSDINLLEEEIPHTATTAAWQDWPASRRLLAKAEIPGRGQRPPCLR